MHKHSQRTSSPNTERRFWWMEFVSTFNACSCYGNWDNVQHFSLVDATTGTKFSTSHWCDNWDKVQHISLVRQLGQSSTHLIGGCNNWDKVQHVIGGCDNWDKVQHVPFVEAAAGTLFDRSCPRWPMTTQEDSGAIICRETVCGELRNHDNA